MKILWDCYRRRKKQEWDPLAIPGLGGEEEWQRGPSDCGGGKKTEEEK